jgi:hypothetical protein
LFTASSSARVLSSPHHALGLVDRDTSATHDPRRHSKGIRVRQRFCGCFGTIGDHDRRTFPGRFAVARPIPGLRR